MQTISVLPISMQAQNSDSSSGLSVLSIKFSDVEPAHSTIRPTSGSVADSWFRHWVLGMHLQLCHLPSVCVHMQDLLCFLWNQVLLRYLLPPYTSGLVDFLLSACDAQLDWQEPANRRHQIHELSAFALLGFLTCISNVLISSALIRLFGKLILFRKSYALSRRITASGGSLSLR